MGACAASRLSCDPSPYPTPLCMGWSSSDHQTKTTRAPPPLSTCLSDWQTACDSPVAQGAHSLPISQPAWEEQQQTESSKLAEGMRGDKKRSLTHKGERCGKDQQHFSGLGQKTACEGNILPEIRGGSHFAPKIAHCILIHP